MRLEFTRPDTPDVIALIRASDDYMAALYPSESNHLLDVASLSADPVRFLVATLEDRPIGCGAVVLNGDWGELKRMWVDPAARGRGIGAALLDRLKSEAESHDVGVLRLETGIKQPEAIGLYEGRGFRIIGPFGDYGPDPLSLFMECNLSTDWIGPSNSRI